MAHRPGTVIGFFLGILPGSGGSSPLLPATLPRNDSPRPRRSSVRARSPVLRPQRLPTIQRQPGVRSSFGLGNSSNRGYGFVIGSFIDPWRSTRADAFPGTPEGGLGRDRIHVYRECDAIALEYPMIPLWVRCLKIPYQILFPLILLFC